MLEHLAILLDRLRAAESVGEASLPSPPCFSLLPIPPDTGRMVSQQTVSIRAVGVMEHVAPEKVPVGA